MYHYLKIIKNIYILEDLKKNWQKEPVEKLNPEKYYSLS